MRLFAVQYYQSHLESHLLINYIDLYICIYIYIDWRSLPAHFVRPQKVFSLECRESMKRFYLLCYGYWHFRLHYARHQNWIIFFCWLGSYSRVHVFNHQGNSIVYIILNNETRLIQPEYQFVWFGFGYCFGYKTSSWCLRSTNLHCAMNEYIFVVFFLPSIWAQFHNIKQKNAYIKLNCLNVIESRPNLKYLFFYSNTKNLP